MPMDRCVCGVLLLALCWSLGATQSLKIKVVDDEGKVKRDFSDSNAAFQERSYLLPAKQKDAIKGFLVYPIPRNACSVVAPPPSNDTYIAFLEEYETCPEISVNYLKTAGFSAIIAYSANSIAYLYGKQYIIPQALILDKKFSTYLTDFVIPGTNESSDLMVVIWDDSFAKLEQLFIIFGAILLVAVVLSVCVFCSSLFCRVALVRWRTRGLTSWQVRSLPKRKFRKAKEMMDTCSICLDEFKEGETVRVLPCDHVFHPKCVDEWLKKWNRTCPLCKSTIKRRGGRTQNPPAHTDENETSLLLPQSRTASTGNEDRVDGESPTYGATGMNTLSPGPGRRGHRHHRGGSGSSSGNSAGHRNQVTSAEIELSAESNPERLSSPMSLYHTPLQSDNEEEQTPSYATAHSGRASASFHSVSTEQI